MTRWVLIAGLNSVLGGSHEEGAVTRILAPEPDQEIPEVIETNLGGQLLEEAHADTNHPLPIQQVLTRLTNVSRFGRRVEDLVDAEGQQEPGFAMPCEEQVDVVLKQCHCFIWKFHGDRVRAAPGAGAALSG